MEGDSVTLLTTIVFAFGQGPLQQIMNYRCTQNHFEPLCIEQIFKEADYNSKKKDLGLNGKPHEHFEFPKTAAVKEYRGKKADDDPVLNEKEWDNVMKKVLEKPFFGKNKLAEKFLKPIENSWIFLKRFDHTDDWIVHYLFETQESRSRANSTENINDATNQADEEPEAHEDAENPVELINKNFKVFSIFNAAFPSFSVKRTDALDGEAKKYLHNEEINPDLLTFTGSIDHKKQMNNDLAVWKITKQILSDIENLGISKIGIYAEQFGSSWNVGFACEILKPIDMINKFREEILTSLAYRAPPNSWWELGIEESANQKAEEKLHSLPIVDELNDLVNAGANLDYATVEIPSQLLPTELTNYNKAEAILRIAVAKIICDSRKKAVQRTFSVPILQITKSIGVAEHKFKTENKLRLYNIPRIIEPEEYATTVLLYFEKFEPIEYVQQLRKNSKMFELKSPALGQSVSKLQEEAEAVVQKLESPKNSSIWTPVENQPNFFSIRISAKEWIDTEEKAKLAAIRLAFDISDDEKTDDKCRLRTVIRERKLEDLVVVAKPERGGKYQSPGDSRTTGMFILLLAYKLVEVRLESVFKLNVSDKVRHALNSPQPEKLMMANIGYPDKLAFVIKNVFDASQCEQLINLVDTYGYEDLKIEGVKEDMGQQALVYSTEFATPLFSKIKDSLTKVDKSLSWSKVNNRLEFLKSSLETGNLKPHARLTNGNLFTLQIYLNQDDGSETHLIGLKGPEGPRVLEVKPEVGMILIFQHDLQVEEKSIPVPVSQNLDGKNEHNKSKTVLKPVRRIVIRSDISLL